MTAEQRLQIDHKIASNFGDEKVRVSTADLREVLSTLDALRDNVKAKEQAIAALASETPSVERLLNVARGCHDYGGGHHGDGMMDAYQHGIQTVINALEAAAKNDPRDTQTNALERVGLSCAAPSAIISPRLCSRLACAGDDWQDRGIGTKGGGQ